VFGDSRWAQEFRAWANFGFSGNRSSAIPGTNAKLSEFHAAVGLASLDEWEIKKVGWTARCGRASQYNAEFDISPGYFEDGSISPYWNVQLDSAKSASDLIEYMRVNGIETRQWWGVPLDAMPAFMDVEKEKNLKNSEMLAGRTVGLPMHSRLTEADLERIASHIWDFLSLRAN
jgi:dTDP-4-amino-4,6-dideoxygalactose transaminase